MTKHDDRLEALMRERDPIPSGSHERASSWWRKPPQPESPQAELARLVSPSAHGSKQVDRQAS